MASAQADPAESFLARVADALLVGRSDTGILDLSDTAVVFANRRAGLFFGRVLSERLGRAFWSPRILTLSDLLAQSDPTRQVADPLARVVLLHRLWNELGAEEALADFFAFGQRLAEDLDEIDRYQADPDQLLQNLSELKALESWAGLEAESLEPLRRFWETLSPRPLRVHQAQWLAQFDRLRPLYHRYAAELEARGWTTEGKLARRMAQRLKAGDEVALPASRVLFAGLGALGAAEVEIVKRLVQRGVGQVVVDADRYYTTWEAHEAYELLRPQLELAGPESVPSRLGQQPLTLERVSAAHPTGVARAAGLILARLQAEGSLEVERTAVILADEGLLFGVLQQLPEGLGECNVTMGYALWQTALARLLGAVVDLQLTAWRDSRGEVTGYPLTPLRSLLQHPYLQLADTSGVNEWLAEKIGQGWTFVGRADLPSELSPLHTVALHPLRLDAALLPHLSALLLEVKAVLSTQAGQTAIVDLEALYHTYTQLERLRDLAGEAMAQGEVEGQWRLIRQVLQSARIPFSGEPLKGLQLMGLLEARALEFDTVILLSANEGILPRGGSLGQSLLPYALRRAFGLPTPDTTDAVSSYNFYRLLQGARRAYLVYDSAGDDGGGEPSRYLLQLEHELAARSKHVTLTRSSAVATAELTPTPDYTRAKTAEMLARLAAERLSPTQLQTYVACPMRFYYRYVERLPEPAELRDELDARQFGNVLHRTLEQVYQPLLGRVCGPGEFEQAQGRVTEALREAAEREPALRHTQAGKNVLLLRVIEALVRAVVSHDEHLTTEQPLTPQALEHRLERELTLASGQRVTISGIADRIDAVGDIGANTGSPAQRRLIDYKTGRVKLPGKTLAPEQLLERLLSEDEFKETLLGLIYAWLMNDDAAVAAGRLHVLLYPMREVGSGPVALTEQDNVARAWADFERRLRLVVSELFDPAVPFVQKKEPDRCRPCAYHRLCYGL